MASVSTYKPGDVGSYCVACTRGSSSRIIDVWVQARSADDARAKLRALGYDPVF